MPIAVIRLRAEPSYRRNAFAKGLHALGYNILDGRGIDHWKPGDRNDLLVLWNRKAGTEEMEAEQWEKRGGTVLVVENAYLQKVDKTMYAISVGQHNGAGWFPVHAEDRFTPLGFDLKPMVHRPDGYVLIAGQRGIGSKLMASPANWGEKHRVKLMGRRTVLRNHPGAMKPRTPLEVDLAGANEVHIWSSSVGVRALVEGIPVKHHAPHWICNVTSGYADHRPSALNYMAHGQWTVAEIESGEPFARMKACNWGIAC